MAAGRNKFTSAKIGDMPILKIIIYKLYIDCINQFLYDPIQTKNMAKI